MSLPSYPFAFQRALVAPLLLELLSGDRRPMPDAFHASPPCQRYSILSKSHNGRPQSHPDLIGMTRALLLRTGKPFVIENVEGARDELKKPVMLCGTMFEGLRVLRHRLFECHGITVDTPAHGDHPLVYTRDKRKLQYDLMDEATSFVMVNGGGNCSIAAAASAMGIDWMDKGGLNEAVPPAYTNLIGEQLLDAVSLKL